MAIIPTTSTTLLQELGSTTNAARWGLFVTRYEPMMRAYLQMHFPRVEADDIIQETFIALIKILPNYHYNPEISGSFHNYLTGIVRKRALQACRAQDKHTQTLEVYATEQRLHPEDTPSLKHDILEIALRQLLADERLSAQSRQVFQAVAVNEEAPADVAARFHITRNNVDQIKRRLTQRLQDLVHQLEILV